MEKVRLLFFPAPVKLSFFYPRRERIRSRCIEVIENRDK